jgi:hypothetical protein
MFRLDRLSRQEALYRAENGLGSRISCQARDSRASLIKSNPRNSETV